MNRLIKYIRQFFGAIEKVSDWSLVRQDSAHNSQDIEGRPLEFAVVLDNGYQAVCDNRNIDLYPNSVLGVSPEGCHFEMLLYPSEEQLNLPSLLVQQSYITSLEHKVVCQERERSLQFRSIVDYPPESTGILLLALIAREAYRLIKQNVIRVVQQVFSVHDFVVEMRLLSDDEVGVDDVDSVQSGKVIIAFVKNVECIRLIRNVIHRIHIMDFCFRDMNIGRYLSHNVEKCVNLDSSLCFSEECPLEQTQAEVNGGGVKRIELSMQDKLPVQSLALSKIDHVVGELFKYPVVPVGIRVGNIAELDVSAAKSEMITLILDGINDTDYFPEAVAAGKLSVHHHKKLIPACEGLHILVSTVLLDDSIEDSLRQKLNELTEKIFSAIHAGLCCFQEANLRNQLKSTRDIFAYN